MRLSIDVPNPLNLRAVVFLDGIKVEYCLMADDEAGEVERYAVDEFGKLRRPQADSLATETLRGRVRIVDPEAVDLGEVYLK